MELSLKMHNNKPNVDVEIRRTRLTFFQNLSKFGIPIGSENAETRPI